MYSPFDVTCVCACVYVCVSPSNLQAGSNLVVGVVHLQHGRQTQQAKLADHTKLAHGQLINREMPAERDAKGMCVGARTVKCQFVSTNTYVCTYVRMRTHFGPTLVNSRSTGLDVLVRTGALPEAVPRTS